MAYEKDTDRYEDVLLNYNDIQSLSSRAALVAFFSTLRYNTDQRLEQTTAAMDFTSDLLRNGIKYFERLAFHEDFDTFSVYLFELNRLNVSIRNEIVRNFRNRSGNYLLVLTEDYERLDFVLVERYTQAITIQEDAYEVQSLFPGNKPALARPRVLQVERRTPGEVELRVLRRFTYTEGDTIAQYEKLLNAYIVAAWSEPFFNNRGLFSDYYLTQRFPEQGEWKDEQGYNEMRRAFRKLLGLYDDARENCSGKSVQVIWQQLLESVFQELGFSAQRAKAKPNETPNSYYRLFAASSQRATDEKPLAACLIYPWERNLDGKDDQRDAQTPDENPGAVVVTLLDSGEVDWAMVTNGIIWRLYAAKAHSRSTNYYEINLQETLALDPSKREEAFRYFWLFFRASAFVPAERIVEGEQRHLSLLDDLLLQSDLHARELGERLKNRVFEEIFPHFALGFVHHARQNNLLPAHLHTLDTGERNRLIEPYFTGTLTFLYRLLFLFYAESRDLLPVRQERSYYECSLERLKQEIAKKAGNVQDHVSNNLASYAENSTAIYDRLIQLFAAVDKGNAALNVPIYNGGLFMTNPPEPAKDEPQEITVARFLKEHKITDRQLALGLDRMARDVDEKLSKVRLATGEANDHSHALIFIDYKSLGVRHLGSIYEGLLEFKLHIAPETMAVVEGKRTEEIIPYNEAKQQNRRILKIRQGKELKERLYAQGTVYLENDRRERKATGSYYTPDYIVQYIVEQTVGPILKEKFEALRDIFRRAQEHLKSEQSKSKASRRTDTDPAHNTYKAYRISLNEVFFDVKVLDPAMGSGHFLVEVVDYITDQMAKFLNGFRWNPVIHELALTRKKIEDGMREQGVIVDRDKLTDLNLLKRRVLKSCVYGVDMNPMAVELAKVSLWLDCFTLGAPLSFLDHHMKCGNSLIGADVEKVHMGISENLFGYQFSYLLQAAQLMRGVSKLSDVTAREVAESHENYQQAYEALAPYKRLFDVWLSQYFSKKKVHMVANQYAKEIVDDTYSHLNKNDVDIDIINDALPLAARKRFFHWELEFPEVFFDEAKRKKDGGFDAVVGNPPYRVLIRSQVGNDLLQYYNSMYKTSQYNPNLFALMIEKAVRVSKRDGLVGSIVPSLWLLNKYFSHLRRFLADSCHILQLTDLGFGVFEEIVETGLIFAKKTSVTEQYNVYLSHKSMGSEQIDYFPREISSKDILENIEHGYNFFNQEEIDKNMFTKTTKKLSDFFIVYRGVETKDNEKYLAEKIISLDYKPILMGTDINRYLCEWTKTYIRFVPKELKSNADIRMYDVPEKVLLRRTGSQLIAGFDSQRLLAIKNLYVIIPKSDLSAKFLLALLNSKLLDQYNQANLSNAGDAFAQLKKTDIEDFPIRRINFTTSSAERARCLDKARLLYRQCISKNDQDCVLGFVNHHLAQEPEEADIVHDLLAFLAEEMLWLNKEKRTRQKHFLDYFTAAMQIKAEGGKIGIEVLTGKSKLLEFAGDYQKGEEPLMPEALWEIVQKNRSRLNAGRIGLKERVLAEYQQSLDQILPLKEQLQRTDALIDQVVYRLYGLTEEEITIVEDKK